MEQETSGASQLLAAIVNSSFDAIISKTVDGTITSWNPAAAKLFGYSPDEMIGKSIRRLIPAERQDEEARIVAKIKAGERVEAYETVRLHKNGDPIDVYLTISPIQDARGRIIGGSKIIRDITSRKKATENLRLSEERLRQFVEHAPAAIAMLDREMRYLACSDRWLKDYWLKKKSLVGCSHHDEFPEIPERWKEIHRRGLAGEVVRAEEDPFKRADGRTQWLRWEVRPWLTGDGAVGGITIMSEDITQRVEAVRALRDKEDWMRLAQEAAKVGTWEWCLADNRNQWSENIWGLYGLVPESCTPSYEAWASTIHPADRERVIQALREAVASGREYEAQWRVNLPEDEPARWLFARGKPLMGANSAPERYIGVVIDITERKRMEEALRESEERLRFSLRGAKAGAWQWDIRAKKLTWSPECFEVHGLDPRAGEPTYDGWLNSLHPDDRADAKRVIFEAVARKATEYSTEYRILLPSGEVRWLASIGKVDYAADGSPVRLSGLNLDITQRKWAEESLRESEGLLRLALNGAGAVAWRWDVRTNRLVGSQDSFELYGRDLKSDEASVYDQWLESVHPDDRVKLREAVADAFEKGSLEYSAEFRFIGPSGQERWINALASVEYTADGVPLRLAGINIDISKRKQAEEALQKAKELERQKRKELEAILAAIPAPVLIATDASCETMIGNPAAYDLYRLPHGSNIAKSAPAGKAPANFEIFQNGRLMAGEKLPIRKAAAKQTFSAEEIELRFIEGDSKFLFGNALPLLNDAGEVRGAVAAFTDVTKLKRTESALRESEELLRISLRGAGAAAWQWKIPSDEMLWSEEGSALYGLDPMRGPPKRYEAWLRCLHRGDRGRVERTIFEAISKGTPEYEVEFRVLHPSGEVRWLHAMGTVEYTADGAPLRMAGINLDITDRRKGEEALRQAEKSERQKRKELETILAALPAAVMIAKDPSCLDLTGNPAAYELLQLPHGVNYSKLVMAEKTPKNYDLYQDGRRLEGSDLPLKKAVAKIPFSGEEVEIRFADGSSKFLLGNALPILNDADEVRGAVAAYADITELKRTEAALRESEERLRFALEAANAGTWEVSPETGELAASDRALSFLGIPPGTPVTHEMALSRAHSDDRPLIEKGLRHALETGDSYRMEWRSLLPDGSMRWLETRGERRTVAGKRVVSGLVLDITDRKKSEEEAKAAGSKLEAALAAMADAVVILDAEGRFIHFNEAFATFHKFKPKGDCVRTFAEYSLFLSFYLPNGDMVPLDDWPLQRALRGETATAAEYTIKRRSGEIYVGSYNFAPIRNGEGDIIGAVATARDITDQKRAENRLRESEARLSSIIDTAADSILVIDENGTIHSANHASANIFGYGSEELIDRHVSIVMPPDFGSRHDGYLKSFTASGVHKQVEGRRKDGSAVPVDLAVAVWRDGEGRRFFTGILRDLTENRRKEEELANVRRLEAVGQLAGGVAHDFNNLLHVISGNLEIAQDLIGDDKTRDFLQRARSAAEKGSALNKRLLSLARKRAFKPERLNLNERVEETTKLLATTVGEHIAVVTDLDANLWPALADPGEIDSAILNLAANARDAMPGGGEIRITTSNIRLGPVNAKRVNLGAKPGDYVRLTIADTGVGMTEEVLAKAMEPFFTTKGPGAGTGLGLASVANFARQTGGFACIKSAPGEGCAVSIYLPRAAKGEAERTSPQSESPLGDGQLVLVVEDDDQVREVTLKRLESLGYAAIAAKTGPDAVDTLTSDGEVRLVLSDVVMPGGMTGYDVARWVASNKPDIKVVMCSGYTEKDRGGQPVDNTILLGKPYTRDQLAQALNDALAP